MNIRETINVAKQEEDHQHDFEQFLATKVPELHRNISLPEQGAPRSLLTFVTRYVEHVADIVEALSQLTRHLDTYEFAKPILELIEGYFNAPPEFIARKHQGLHALIDEAYLAHRLIEEVNDRMMVISGVPLAPMDMTTSNLIVHDILGEEFANELDSAVTYNVDMLFNLQVLSQNDLFNRYVEFHKLHGWKQNIEQWPCLAGDASIFLALDAAPIKRTLH